MYEIGESDGKEREYLLEPRDRLASAAFLDDPWALEKFVTFLGRYFARAN